MKPSGLFALGAMLAAVALSVTGCSGPGPTLSTSLAPTYQQSASAQPSASHQASPSPSPSATPSASASATKPAPPSATPKPGKPTKTPNPSTASGRWKPKPGLTWQWQLSGKLDTSVNAQVYDVDLFDTSVSQVKQLQSQGRKVICYFSAGSYESGRPDSGDFPASVKGSKMDGWPEYWLDIRSAKVLDIMAERMDLCAKKGFDGVEADNVDGYQNDSGFDLSASDQLKYNKALAKLAHARGLAIGLKNDLDQVSSLQSSFDFAVNEECYEYDECGVLKAFISAGKPVFHVEYSVPIGTFCPTTTKLGFSSMLKDLDLDASRTPCP